MGLALCENLFVYAAARIESNVAKIDFRYRALVVRRCSFERAARLEDYDGILVVKVHGRRLAQLPNIVPDDHFPVFQQFPRVLTGKRERISGTVGNRARRKFLQLDDDGSRS